MNEVEMSKRRLQEGNLSLVIAKEGQIIFETKQSGVGGFLSAIEKFGKNQLTGSAVADRVVGRAAALLCVYCGVEAVYAIVLSRGGRGVLEKNGIKQEFDTLVPNILNRQKTGTCPFEKIVAAISDVNEAYERLKSCMTQMRLKGGDRL